MNKSKHEDSSDETIADCIVGAAQIMASQDQELQVVTEENNQLRTAYVNTAQAVQVLQEMVDRACNYNDNLYESHKTAMEKLRLAQEENERLHAEITEKAKADTLLINLNQKRFSRKSDSFTLALEVTDYVNELRQEIANLREQLNTATKQNQDNGNL